MTNFYCLGSIGPTLEEVIIDNHNHNHFFIIDNKKPKGPDAHQPSDLWFGKTKWDCHIVWAMPLTYIAGSIGYAISAVRKVILLAANILLHTFDLPFRCVCCRKGPPLKERGIILLDSLLALTIALIGCVCSPLAYYLDRKARNAMMDLAGYKPSPEERSSFF